MVARRPSKPNTLSHPVISCGLWINDVAESERDAQTPRTPSTTPRQASPSAARWKFQLRTRHRPRRSPRRAWPTLARCGPGHAPTSRQRRCRSTGSPPQMCHRRFACQTRQRYHAQDALRAPPSARARDLGELRAEYERHQDSVRHAARAPERSTRVEGSAKTSDWWRSR